MFRTGFFLSLVASLYMFTGVSTANEGQAGAWQSNHDLEPTVILISIDGMRYDYLDRYYAPNLNWLAKEGVRSDSLVPVFPTKTFPNHYSLVTGLYTENHGMIDNRIYDPEFDAVFSMGNADEVTNPRWWGGEPVWVTAEKQGVPSATYFWPGSEADIQGVRPSYWNVYDGDIPNRDRVRTVIEWLEKPKAERPRVITLYFSDVDSMGHRHGPSSSEVAQALRDIDADIGYLVDRLAERGMMTHVNLMITSDHGMSRVDQTRHMIVDQMFDTNRTVQVNYSREIVSIFPEEGAKEDLYQQLKSAMPEQATVYRKSDLPERWNFRNHRRVAPIVVVAEPGWIFVREQWLEGMKAADDYYRPRGSHGYDNKHREMHGTFFAFGPDFKRNEQVRSVDMVDLYNVITRIVGLEPAPNDGDPAVVPLLITSD